MAKNKKRVDAWADEAFTAPRQYVPNPNENRKARFVRTYMWVATVSLVPVMLLALGVIVNVAAPADAGNAVKVDTFDNTPEGREGQTRARLALNAWLAAEPSPLPGATITGFDGSEAAQAVAPASVTLSGGETEKVQRDNVRVYKYSISTPNGAVWLASVPVGFSASGAQVASSPSVLPAVPSDEGDWGGQSWPGERTVQLGEAVPGAVETWARAYTSGDPEALRLAVGDKTASHSYVPMSGATFVGSEVGQSTVRLKDLDAEGNPPDVPTIVVARASVAVSWPGQANDDSTSHQPFTFDVLVTDANTGSPRVVAWAPAGQGGALEPYANAVTDRVIESGAGVSDQAGDDENDGLADTPESTDETDGL